MTPNTVTRTTNDLVDSLREASPRNSTQDRLFFLCACAANEIDRLQKVIDDYVRICKASAREIRRLRARPETYAKSDGLRCVSTTDGAALTDAERERTNLDAAPAATAVSDEDRTDKAATSHRRDRPGDTPAKRDTKPPQHGALTDAEREAVAWAVMVGGRRMYVSWCKEMCEDEAYYHRHPCGDSVSVAPLYRQPQHALTDAERDAVAWYAGHGAGDHAATLRGLLERMK